MCKEDLYLNYYLLYLDHNVALYTTTQYSFYTPVVVFIGNAWLYMLYHTVGYVYTAEGLRIIHHFVP